MLQSQMSAGELLLLESAVAAQKDKSRDHVIYGSVIAVLNMQIRTESPVMPLHIPG